MLPLALRGGFLGPAPVLLEEEEIFPVDWENDWSVADVFEGTRVSDRSSLIQEFGSDCRMCTPPSL